MAAHDLDAAFDVAVDAARRAGRIQMERYERLERIVHKSEHDVVTEVDHLSEELIIDAIHRVFPSDAFLAEESGHSGGSPRPAAQSRDGSERRAAAPPTPPGSQAGPTTRDPSSPAAASAPRRPRSRRIDCGSSTHSMAP